MFLLVCYYLFLDLVNLPSCLEALLCVQLESEGLHHGNCAGALPGKTEDCHTRNLAHNLHPDGQTHQTSCKGPAKKRMFRYHNW